MLGKPKYKLDDLVSFEFDGEKKIGQVFVVDKFGTFDYTEDVSYDIMVESENMLYKHIPEKMVKRVRKTKDVCK
jgi:hypothetical protein